MRRGLRVLRAMAFYRLKGVRYSGLPYVRGRLPRVRAAGELRVGDRFRMDGLLERVQLDVAPGARMLVGDHVFINRGCVIHAAESVTIGDHTRLGNTVTILDSSLHELDESSGVTVAPVSIGRNVWIGARAIVLPGVTIGDHAVVGAGAVVVRDVPPRSLAVGNPATVVRELEASEGWVRS